MRLNIHIQRQIGGTVFNIQQGRLKISPFDTCIGKTPSEPDNRSDLPVNFSPACFGLMGINFKKVIHAIST